MFSIVLRECTFITWNTSHSCSLKFLRLVPVKSRLLKFASQGYQKLRGKYEVALGISLQRSPMRRSQPPPKVGPYDLKQQIALFLSDFTSGYFFRSVTEKRKVSLLKSVLKCVELLENCSSQLSGVQPPMILLSSVRQRVTVSSQASQISWNCLTLKLWLLARKISLKETYSSKKEERTSKLVVIVLGKGLRDSIGCVGLLWVFRSCWLAEPLFSISFSSWEYWWGTSYELLKEAYLQVRCRTLRIISRELKLLLLGQLCVNLTLKSILSFFYILEFAIIVLLLSKFANLLPQKWELKAQSVLALVGEQFHVVSVKLLLQLILITIFRYKVQNIFRQIRQIRRKLRRMLA